MNKARAAKIIKAARSRQRRLMKRWQEPCLDCGKCNEEWKADCGYDWCRQNEVSAPARVGSP